MGKKISNFFINPQPGNGMVFHRMFTMSWDFVHSQTTSGIAWLQDRAERGNYLCFSILVLKYGNSLIPSFGSCMDFCFMWIMWETHALRIFVFSQNFPVVWEFNFSMFWKLYGSLLQAKYLRNPYFFMFVFSHTFRVPWELTFPMV